MSKKYFLYELKKKSWISGFFIACLVIGYVLAFGRIRESINYSQGYYLSSSIFFISTFIYGAFLFLATLYQFSFFHTKQKVDIYLQMPISRKKLILSNYLIVPILLTIPYLLVNIISWGHTLAIGQEAVYYLPDVYYEIKYCILVVMKMTVTSLFLYSVMVYLATKTGKTIAHAFITVATVVAPCLIYIFTFAIAGETINQGFSSDIYFSYLLTFFHYYSGVYNSVQITYLLIQIAGIIIFPILTIKSFEKYRAENTEKFLTSDRLNSFYLVLISVSVAILSTLIVIALTKNYNFMFLTIMFLAVAFIIFGITTSIFNMSVSLKNFKVKNVVALIVVCFVYSLVMFEDVLGLGASTPNVNNVESVFVNYRQVSMEDIDKVIELQTKASMTGSIHSDINYGYSFENIEEFEPDMAVDSISFIYNMKDGGRVNRMYYLPLDTALYDDLNEIFTSDNYKQQCIDMLNVSKDYYLDCRVNIGNKNFAISDREGFYDALIKDIEADENFGYYTYAPLKFINIDLGIRYEDFNFDYSMLSDLSIGADYQNTIDFINNEYEKAYGEGTTIFDNVTLTTYQDFAQTQKMNSIKDENIEFLPYAYYYYTNSTSDNVENYDVTTYSYDENPEEFMEFVNGEFYYAMNNLIPIKGDKVYGVVLGEYNQNENPYPIAYFTK